MSARAVDGRERRRGSQSGEPGLPRALEAQWRGRTSEHVRDCGGNLSFKCKVRCAHCPAESPSGYTTGAAPAHLNQENGSMAEKFELTDEMRAQIGSESPAMDDGGDHDQRTRLRARSRLHRSGVLRRRRGAPGRLPQPAGAADLSRARRCSFPAGRTTRSANRRRHGRAVNHGLKGLLDGGTETEYFADICAGDTLTIVSRIAALDVRTSPTSGQDADHDHREHVHQPGWEEGRGAARAGDLLLKRHHG